MPDLNDAAERAANEQIATAIDLLCKVPTKSTAHMEQEERRDGLGVMLADLFTLARKDGCIAAAWAYEFACEVAPVLARQLAERDETAAKHRKRCEQECTRDVIFLFQRRVLNLHGLPDGLDCQEGYVTIENEEEFADDVAVEAIDEKSLEEMRGDGLPIREFMKIGFEYGEWCHQCVQETWLTESVWLDREEAERYGKAKEYNYVDGWRVYGVCANGELASMLKGNITDAGAK